MIELMSEEQIVYLNGEYLPITEAKISVLDRGFLFADGIYEVMPVYNQQLFRLEQHLQRLHNSLEALQIPSPVTDAEYETIFNTLLMRNAHNGYHQVLYLQVTRGAETKRHHNIPTDTHPTLFVKTAPLPKHDHDTLMLGKRAMVLDDIRWARCDIKSISLLANVILNNQAKQNDCEEAILIRDGLVTEGASSNVFMVKNETIITPPLSPFILGGITRDMVIELAAQYSIPFQEKDITKEALFDADEVWITSSTREIFPIISLDGHPVGDGTVGPMWQAMINHLHQFISTL